METAERRIAVLRTLCKRRRDTVENLAFEFGVSNRTIRRDIFSLSLTEPIYTKCGRYDGGIYVVDGYEMTKPYLSEEEAAVMSKVNHILSEDSELLSTREKECFKRIITEYTKPESQKEKTCNNSYIST